MRASILTTLILLGATVYAGMFISTQESSYADGKRFDFEVTGERVLKTPVWKADAESPPLSPRKAEQLATAKFRQLISDTTDWKRRRISLEDTGDSLHWIYVVQFTKDGRWPSGVPDLRVIVLLDGTVVEPRIHENK